MKLEISNMILYGICLLWCGVLIGVSFIATPAKFMVAELDLVTAIKVGRATFNVYHYFEIGMLCLLLVALSVCRVNKIVWGYFSILTIVLALQYLLVQPQLTLLSEELFSGHGSSSNSNLHHYYIFLDCLKVTIFLGYFPAMHYFGVGSKQVGER